MFSITESAYLLLIEVQRMGRYEALETPQYDLMGAAP